MAEFNEFLADSLVPNLNIQFIHQTERVLHFLSHIKTHLKLEDFKDIFLYETVDSVTNKYNSCCFPTVSNEVNLDVCKFYSLLSYRNKKQLVDWFNIYDLSSDRWNT